jgi:hypothetical protein
MSREKQREWTKRPFSRNKLDEITTTLIEPS